MDNKLLKAEKPQPFKPTLANLFGLDVRFKSFQADKLAEVERKSAAKLLLLITFIAIGLKAIMTYVDPFDPFVSLKLEAKKHVSNRHGLP